MRRGSTTVWNDAGQRITFEWKAGALFASGPLTTAPGQPAGDGLTVLRAASLDEARAIAEADPFVINKLRTFEVREWTVMEGSIGLTVNLSDQTLQFA